MAEPLERLKAVLADRYRIERELGAGGMATVYLAEDVKHRRRVAVKVLREDLTVALGKDRFLREITIAAGLTHPHILPLHDSGDAAGRLFYVMPYVDGPTLRQKLLRTGELPIPDAVRILRDVADAMAHAHQHGVVHRDLKPENVMLSGRHAMVTDFGVAKALSEATGRHTLTTAGIALGTPSYMSPEQATADPHADHRSDIYSFGILAYELLAGRPPFSAGSPQEVLAAHLTTVAVPVTQYRPTLPPALASLVMNCLEKKPADRPQSAEELLVVLESILTPSGGLTPTATPPHSVTTAGRLVRFGRRPMAWAAAAAVVGVIALVSWLIGGRASPSGARAKLAVMPLATKSTDSTDVLLAEGLSEQLGIRLSRVPALQVLSAASVSSQWSRTPAPLDAARALGAEWVVTGALRHAGDQVSALVEVVQVGSGVRKWSGSFARSRATFSTLEAAVAESVEVALIGRRVAAARPAAGAVNSPNPEAYRLVLLGNALLVRRTPESVRKAMDYFAQATQLDSGFALAWARLSSALVVAFSWSRWDIGVPRDSLLPRAKVAAMRSIRLDSMLTHGWQALGISETMLAEWPLAQRSLERALYLDSLDAETQHLSGYMYSTDRLADCGRAGSLFRRSVQLDPNRPNTWRWLARMKACLGELPVAEALLDTTLSFGEWSPAYFSRAYVRFLRGNGAGAMSDLTAAETLDSTTYEFERLRYRTASGDRQGALEWLERAPLPRTGAVIGAVQLDTIAQVALLNMDVGRTDDALRALGALPAAELRTWRFLHDPSFLRIRDDPRFRAMLEKSRPAFLRQQ